MHSFSRLLGSAALGLILAGGLVAPGFAQKLDNKVGPATAATPADGSAAGIDFGDDSSEWAKDGECDDPRFEGTGMAEEPLDVDIKKDATDCRAGVEAGKLTLAPVPVEITTTPSSTGIDFGDDSSEWAKDDECDDPRFSGTGMAETLLDEDIKHDATDCRTAFDAGTITLIEEEGEVRPTTDVNDIDFGDDSSQWAKDGECDDPRFTGTASAVELLDEDIKKDATDCRAAFIAGTVTLGDSGASSSTDIDYGDDSGQWAKDEECDDPRFSGSGMATTLLEEDIKKDATDCRAAVEAGTITFNGDDATSATVTPAVNGFDYGNDSSKWSRDGECDDPRFVGEGTNKKLLYEDMEADATDCRTLESDGKVSIREVYTPEYAAGAPYDSSGVEFGDNSSDYANDDTCDDPRFEGPGAAITLLESDREHDSVDCKAAFEAGKIVLIEGAS